MTNVVLLVPPPPPHHGGGGMTPMVCGAGESKNPTPPPPPPQKRSNEMKTLLLRASWRLSREITFRGSNSGDKVQSRLVITSELHFVSLWKVIRSLGLSLN